MTEITFTKAKKKREELKLPQLHFVVMDDWIEKLGHDAFIAWMKFHTWVDRTDEAEQKFGNKNTVPRSLEDVWEALGIKKTKFYQKVVHPLWNYGLIDIVEWKESKKLGQKPKNIVVYEYPQNSYELAVKPLELCRNYKVDYSADAAIFGRKGGRPQKHEEVIKSHRSQMQTVNRSQTKTVTVRKQKPINESNTRINESNTRINESNLSIQDNIETLNIPINIKKILHKNMDRLIDEQIEVDSIVSGYYSHKLITDHEGFDFYYADVICRVLEKTKSKIRNVKDLIDSTIKTDFKQREMPYRGRKPIRKELTPKWVEKQRENENISYEDESNEQQLDLEEKRKFDQLISKFKN